ncbi:hypothetical protein A3A14_02605 [Candidatus Daviesbacteria bacterium RIFCSPLOWO2_01_FULL_43_38]|uniref:Uncharacterized protein n=3 Tax=Candidatus Daviesiibacteriota TaxID=1752718 RepID=A0A1F5K412_9BACT|nr:MAG: hypothetical protein UV33_C0009G0009 [Candidatus Daviesbacteria bacterium GW2011_GWA1_42_6]KKS71082.1 MAG: hypothetical protein UV41_C0006G0034 [Candidatus Daviesbacteria bacterium GW2011_GWA2_42_7]OGE19963.1 MAG: hypothetical protein A2874_00525 [Candidatus Daviesbacteria bacterium RIFCSPHIGHO2_01_FULL_43_17]OGE35713.1 MAG: hypothetical protein A3E45_00210 [Candidatus Daviesbacteria bacterium RIFCSPHIGHO2_12_FULL_43_11]OGE63401.1 MAG: hypothetical protein A3A14_02605 [Candidatus Davies
MDSPEGEGPVKKNNPLLRLACAIGLLGSVACGNTASEQKGVQYGQNMNNRNAAEATATATTKQAEEFKKQADQDLGQNSKPFAER